MHDYIDSNIPGSPLGNPMPKYDVGILLKNKATNAEKAFKLKNTWKLQPGFLWQCFSKETRKQLLQKVPATTASKPIS